MISQNWKFLKLFHLELTLENYSYFSVPCGCIINKDVMRVFFSRRNKLNQSLPFYFDLEMNTLNLISYSKSPVLKLGEIGLFDDSGVMPSCLIKNDKDLFMYYIGWNLGVTVPFRNSLGLAVSKDNGNTFSKLFKGPIVDRTKTEPYFNASACVIKNAEKWKMWYLSCVDWDLNHGNAKHFYHIKYAESNDGINWIRNGTVSIDFKYKNEHAISVPRVFFENNTYKMWYSYRGGPRSENYRIGYAESLDGMTWIRHDQKVNFKLLNGEWASEMQCYPYTFCFNNKYYMLFNGNNYGQTGIGLAVLED